MVSLPTGTVTFLLTGVDGSTAGWPRHPAAMDRHDEIVFGAIAAWFGVRPVEESEGDNVVAVFSWAIDALAAALEIQLALQREPWPDGGDLRVRIGVHTGEVVQLDAGRDARTAVIRTGRICDAARGGQVLVSASAAAIASDSLPDGAELVDAGAHRLRDLVRPERLWWLAHTRSSWSWSRR